MIRIGGLVKESSLKREEGGRIQFLVTDLKTDVTVSYAGELPALFREGQGVVAEGHMADGTFIATRILAKHDEKYMPPEVERALKAQGRWKEGQ